MWLAGDEDAAKAPTIFAAIEERFVVDDILQIILFFLVWTTLMPWLALGTLLDQDFLKKTMKYVLLCVHVIWHTLQQAMEMMDLVITLT